MTTPISSAASTASAAPSVAVTKPPKIPPRMIRGMTSAQIASRAACADVAQIETLLDREIVFAGVIIAQPHQPEAANHARNNAGDENLHRRFLRHRGVEDHRDRRRDDDGKARRRRGDGGSEFLGIAARLHRRNQQRAERSDVGDGGSGNLGKEHRRADRHHRQAAADEAEQRGREIDQPARDRRRIHDAAGQR